MHDIQATTTDQELVALTLQDKDYFAHLMHRYRQKLERYIRRMTAIRPMEVEDLLQDIFIKTYRNLHGFDPRLSFSSWIYRIAHNEVITQYRKKIVRPEGHMVDVEDDVLSNLMVDTNIHTLVDHSFLKNNIATLLNEIDVKYREVLVLKFFEDKDYKEISDILKKPPGTVATLISRAKKQLRQRCEEHWGKYTLV